MITELRLIYYGGLALIQPSCATIKQSYVQNMQNMQKTKYAGYVKYYLVSCDLCTPPVQKHRHLCAF